ncbi:chaplin family protein [Streptomyces sp. G45]|uniref:chaplin family protein n=1 Tax=Streptomyces sp. G45 TaxID=3406627 RepID=UPI003C25293B
MQAPVDVPVNACGNTVDAAAALNPSFGNRCGNKAPDQGAAARSDQTAPGYGETDRAERSVPSATRATPSGTTPHGSSSPGPGASAQSDASGSPGVLSGNSVQAPVEVPVNACGNTVDAAAALNPAFGNECANAPEPVAEPPRPPLPPRAQPPKSPERPSKPSAPRPEEHVPAPRPAQPPTRGTAHTPQQAPAEARPVAPRLAATGADADLAAAAAVSVGLLAGGMVLYRRGRAGAGR